MIAPEWILSLVLVLQYNFISCEIDFKKGAPHVKLSNGALLSGSLGYSRDGRPFSSFVGVPYGKIPERFEEAQPAPMWKGVLNATTPGNACVQKSYEDGAKTGEEDCLNLYVYVPMNNTQQKEGFPVMVWIHGGGFLMGNGFEYGPKFFMDNDVILVSINYRLGAFGFLTTSDSVITGNNGLKDAVLALRWIQENIGHFGGDSGKVTIVGESGGGALVHYLLLSPTTKGLFHRAISQSGTALSPWAYNPKPRATTVKLATHLKCPTEAEDQAEISSDEIATCLKGVSADELLKAQFEFVAEEHLGDFPIEFMPVKEPKDSNSPFLTESPWNMILESTVPHKEIPWIVGVTEDEGVLFVDNPILIGLTMPELDKRWEDVILALNNLERIVLSEEKSIVAGKIRQFYFGDKAISEETMDSLGDLYSDAWFVHGTRKAAISTALKGEGNPVYLYQFAQQGPMTMLQMIGAHTTNEEFRKKVAHGDDYLVQFDFDSMIPDPAHQIKFDAEQEEFSKNFIKLWVSFAIHGKPSHTWATSKDTWSPIPKSELEGTTPLRWYRITSSPGYIDEGRWKERTLFWNQLYNDHFLQFVLDKKPISGGAKIEL